MVAFYKHNIVDWRSGTVNLSDRAYRLYHVLIEEIMLNEGPVPLHERSLAGKSNRSTRDFRAALQELVDAGKITVQDGFVSNSRCESELNTVRTNRETAANGGRNSGEVRRKDKEINADCEAPLPSAPEHKREEKRIDTVLRTDASASGGDFEANSKAAIFGPGVQWLTRVTGTSEASCRGLIGRWLKITHNDPDSVLAAMRRARAEQVAEPKAFITGVLQARHQPRGASGTVVALATKPTFSKPAARP